MGTSANLTNVASPLTTEFNPDELCLLIGTCLPDAVAVLDPRDGALVGANRQLEEFLGASIPPGSATRLLDDFVHPEDLAEFRLRRSALPREGGEAEGVTTALRFSTPRGTVTATVRFSSFRWNRKSYTIAYIRHFVEEGVVERELREKIAEQKKKTLEAIKSSVLIYQFTEKIKNTPVLTTRLLSADDEAELFERAARILTGEGLNYKDVMFLLMEEGKFAVSFSTKPHVPHAYLDGKNPRYLPFIEDSSKGLQANGNEILVPLRSRGTFLGLIEITLHPRERIFFDEMNLVSEWQKDALRTIGDMIALMLDNLRLYREVKRQSIIDPLTGVYNRNYFTDRLSSEISRCVRSGSPISMIFIDVDHFKQINDTYGHFVGDQILRGLGLILRENFRGYDFICRFGGDEFVVLLPGVDGESASKVATDLLGVVRNYGFHLSKQPARKVPMSVSIGVSVLDKDLDENAFLRAADSALYKAKELGRNQLFINSATDPTAGEAPPEVEEPAARG